MIRHKVVIESMFFFWWKKYRYACNSCGEKGKWYNSYQVATAQGWYHDDVTLMETLTRRPVGE